MNRLSLLSGLTGLILSACASPDPHAPFAAVEANNTFDLPVREPAHIVFTEGGVPHIFASDRRDLAVVWGFQIARDRYFMMDLSRRLALGTLSEILGADAFPTDLDSRADGNRQISERTLEMMERYHPDLIDQIDGYAEGVNAYVDYVHQGILAPPSEYTVAASLLGADNPSELVTPFDRLAVVAGAATVLAMSGFTSSDIERGLALPKLDTWFDGYDHQDLRQAGLRPDIWDRVEPGFDVASAPDFTAVPFPDWRTIDGTPSAEVQVPTEPAERIRERHAQWDRWRGRDWEHGFGSNAWAVHGAGTVDGRALLAGDGHLGLTIPPLFYSIGLDTAQLSEDDDLTFAGMAVPGVPVPGPGTNGHIAWSQIAFFGDLTDWYREEVRLNGEGRIVATRFQGEWRSVERIAEEAVIRDVPLLGSVGRQERWERYRTFDGRLIADIEGRRIGENDSVEPGERAVRMGRHRIVPADTDGDGRITAISFDYAPLDGTGALVGFWGFADARDVRDFQQASRELVGNSAGLIAADKDGEILYTGLEAVPCRNHLPRRPDGSFAAGADPRMLIDGTRYPGFTVPFSNGRVDYRLRGDPTRCLVPEEGYPHSFSPTQGYVVAANNDPSGQTFDGDLTNDGWYLGGPWLEGTRADTISRELAALVADRAADIPAMERVQANHDSRLGEWLVPLLIDALDLGERASLADGPAHARRMAAIWRTNEDRFDEARDRLLGWAERGFQARSGVETFYHTPGPFDIEDAVATMIFNAWLPRFNQLVLDDERLPSGSSDPTGDSGRLRFLRLHLLEGRGPGNPSGLASYNPATQESIYFDRNGTPEVEVSDELMLMALVAALDYLTAEPTGPGEGGFGTPDMNQWLWGMRHGVRFVSVLQTFLGNDPAFSALTQDFSITPRRFPVAEGLSPSDPRRNLPTFPRPGDALNVDAANPGNSGIRFGYNSGPVFRLVVALGPDGPEGVNVLPGGQSGLNDSPHFDDQAKLWLGNRTLPLHFGASDVLSAAVGRTAIEPH